MTSQNRLRWALRLGLVLLALLGLSVVVAGLALWRAPLATSAYLEGLALRRAGFERATADGPRGPVYYWRAGTGAPVLFLHGANDQAGVWSHVVTPLLPSHRVLLVDLPGHGQSAPAEGPLSVEVLLAGVEAVLEAEAAATPAVLVGNSLGGWLALIEAHRHPEEVSRVVLVNGAALRGDGSEAQVNLLPRDRAEARAAIEAVTSPHSPPVPDFVLDDLVRRAPGSPLARLLQSDWESSSLDGRLGEIAAPVLLLWGEDDRVLPLAYAERVAAQLPAARLEPLGRCGHIPMRECPEILIPILREAIDGPAPGTAALPTMDHQVSQ
jgi:pimeloyl-ACP methyl ester carboxylesterase